MAFGKKPRFKGKSPNSLLLLCTHTINVLTKPNLLLLEILNVMRFG
jgi:hypothetical protein